MVLDIISMGSLTLVDKLTALFKGIEPEKIDNYVSEAKKRAKAEELEARRKELEKFFNRQMKTLQSQGCPETIIEGFYKKQVKVISEVAKMDIPKENIPFLPVIPQAYLGTYRQISIVQHNGNSGYTYINPQGITNVVGVPKGLYFVIDVEDGKATKGKSPEKAEKIIKSDNRTCLTCDEVLALCLHTDVLSDHFVDATGSLDNGFVPNVSIANGRPKLYGNSVSNVSIYWGSPSAHSRI